MRKEGPRYQKGSEGRGVPESSEGVAVPEMFGGEGVHDTSKVKGEGSAVTGRLLEVIVSSVPERLRHIIVIGTGTLDIASEEGRNFKACEMGLTEKAGSTHSHTYS
jgi:hypothetical protein